MGRTSTLRAQFLRSATLISACVATFSPLVAGAASVYWIGGSGSWSDGTNWSTANQPQPGDYVYLTQSDSIQRTVDYSNLLYPSSSLGQLIVDATGAGRIILNQTKDPLVIGNEYVGYFGYGTHNQSGGTNVANALLVGQFSGSNGTYNLSGTGGVTALQEVVGSSGGSTGVFNQNGGTNTVGSPTSYSSQFVVGSAGIGSYNLNSGTLTVQNTNEIIGNFGTGTFTQTGGVNFANSGIVLGYASTGTGTYVLSGTGSLVAGLGGIRIGWDGTGQFIQNGGTATTSYLTVNRGSYNMTDGNLNVTQSETVSMTFSQSGGTHTVSGALNLWSNGATPATFTLSGGALTTGSERIAYAGDGVFIHNNGTHTVNGDLEIDAGVNGNGVGIYNLNGGVLSVGGNITSGLGTLNIGNGTLSVGGGNGSTSVRNFNVGNTAGSNGSHTLSGTGTITAANETIGNSGTGALTQTGGTNTVTNTLTLAANAGSSGTYNLNGGLLNALNIVVNSGGTFNFNGGTLAVGTFSGNLANIGGTLTPGGGAPGTTNILGNFSQSGAGTLAVTLAGTGLGQFSAVHVSGTATLSGTLDISLFGSGLFGPGYTPQFGDTFDILSATSLSGQFTSLIYAPLSNGLVWDVSYLTDGNGSVVSLKAVPIPAAIWLLGSGLVGLLNFSRRRRH